MKNTTRYSICQDICKLFSHFRIWSTYDTFLELKKSVDQFQRALTIFFQLTFTSTGLSVDLHLGISISFRRSSIYFRWEINIPCFDLVTSMPRKYFRLPKSFVSNSLARRCFKFCISPSSFLVKTISSTFIIKAASFLEWNA
jgi:hypothetical protein